MIPSQAWFTGAVKVHTVGWSARRDEADHDKRITEMTVYRWPLWAWLLDTVADALCAMTRHRFCNSRYGFVQIDRLSWSRVEMFSIPVPEEEIERFERWRWGRAPYWVDDDDDPDGPPIQIGPDGYRRA